MQTIADFKQQMATERPVSWDSLPDLPLYMDQLKMFMMRQLIDLQDDGDLTAAMIHNYAKAGVMPRPAGKCYTREHIVYLTVISMLKQVMPTGDIQMVMPAGMQGESAKAFYEKVTALLDAELTKTQAQIPEVGEQADYLDTALRLAVSAYVGQMACHQILDRFKPVDEKPAKEKKEKTDKDKKEKADKKK